MQTTIQAEDYEVQYLPETNEVVFQGSLRLSGAEEYQPIVDLLESLISDQSVHICLDLRKLEFLNSSGINILSKFVINARKRNTIEVTVRGAKTIPWQSKSLKNLQRLMPNLKLEIE
ncbi:MAG: hypothetical protein RMK91_08180 [Pseudanabaenaceae cyanobacterium SKYGB_i_bin29]|nr:hypothetical protein [Pseudanabaenaceae cyanobacterium SKYG29]MDW8421832.1 hypothetical protein [Pseudanabaenaceae cyanobacterium SKYGB_i_bin29]